MNAPESPPTDDDAMTPPFLTASVSSASAAVVPGAPVRSRPIASRISATESPIAGVGASDKSTMPKRTPSPRRAATSRPMSSPARVTLNDMRLTVSATSPRSILRPLSRRRRIAESTTPGPADADVEHAIAFADAVQRAGDERVVVGDVGEHDQLGAADAAAIGGALGQRLDDAPHVRDGVHVDAGARGGHVDRRADALRDRERLGDRVEQHRGRRAWRPSRRAPRSRPRSRCRARRRRDRASRRAARRRRRASAHRRARSASPRCACW